MTFQDSKRQDWPNAISKRIQDFYGRQSSASFTIIIDSVLSITTSKLNDVVSGSVYNQTVSATGGLPTYTWSVTSGTLPTGLNLAPLTGIISGTAGVVGSQQFVVTALDSDGRSTSRQFTINVTGPLTLLTTSMPNGAINETYTEYMKVSGGIPPYSFTVTGQLPVGLTLNSSSGLISGIPTLAGLTNAAISVTDSSWPTPQSLTSKPFSIRIWSLATIVTTATLPSVINNTAMTPVTLTAKAGTAPYAWSLFSGTMPTGVTISTDGVISGTPAVAGNYSFTIRATDSSATPFNANKLFYLHVGDPIQITTQSISYGAVGVPFSSTLYAANGVMPYTWLITSGTLPAGLSFSAAGIISGTPTTVGSSTVTFRVTDSDTPAQTITKTLTVYIDPLTIVTQSLPNVDQGTAYNTTISTTGNPVPTLTYTGTLPSGLTFTDKGNGTATISGTVVYGTAGSYPITVSATNASGTVNQPYSLMVNISMKTLSVSVLGDGKGDVNSSPGGITCSEGTTGTCSLSFPAGNVQLLALPSSISLFGGWTGCTSSVTTTCDVFLDSNKSVSATFNPAPKAKIGATEYGTLNAAYLAAYNAPEPGATINLLEIVLTEDLVVIGKDIVLVGGHSGDYQTRSGLPTIVKGKLTVKGGSVRTDGVVVRDPTPPPPE
jgi:hypothetical protein